MVAASRAITTYKLLQEHIIGIVTPVSHGQEVEQVDELIVELHPQLIARQRHLRE